MGNIERGMNDSMILFRGLLVLGLLGLVFLIIFGNLSGNLGFAANSVGANDTNAVINNLTGGATTYFGFANVWFVLGAVALLIVIAVGLIGIVTRGFKTGGGKFSS